jgi:hypothetical protein
LPVAQQEELASQHSSFCSQQSEDSLDTLLLLQQAASFTQQASCFLQHSGREEGVEPAKDIVVKAIKRPMIVIKMEVFIFNLFNS